jgi:DNA-binding CsgD family transcriptional regulator
MSSTGGGAGDWYSEVVGIIDKLGSERFPARLITALERLLPFEMAAIFVYRGRSRPLAVFDNFEPAEAKKGIAAYVESTYVLNPFYQAVQNGLCDGVYLMRELAPDAYFESGYDRAYKVLPNPSEEIGYVTEHWPKGMEELNIAIIVEDGVLAEITLSRSHREQGFGESDVSKVTAVFPVISAAFRNFWREFGATGSQALPPDSRVDDAFACFGKSALTDRECEVTQLILKGHSSESICGNLGISLGTVKTHRKNAYAKLNISSQSELLSQFLQSLQTL